MNPIDQWQKDWADLQKAQSAVEALKQREIQSRFQLRDYLVTVGLNPTQVITKREREVLHYVLQGISNKQIGEKLCISERTVKFHVSSLLIKADVPTRRLLKAEYFYDQMQNIPVPADLPTPDAGDRPTAPNFLRVECTRRRSRKL